MVRSSGQMLIGFFLSLHRLLLRKMDPLWPFHRIFGCFFFGVLLDGLEGVAGRPLWFYLVRSWRRPLPFTEQGKTSVTRKRTKNNSNNNNNPKVLAKNNSNSNNNNNNSEKFPPTFFGFPFSSTAATFAKKKEFFLFVKKKKTKKKRIKVKHFLLVFFLLVAKCGAALSNSESSIIENFFEKKTTITNKRLRCFLFIFEKRSPSIRRSANLATPPQARSPRRRKKKGTQNHLPK